MISPSIFLFILLWLTSINGKESCHSLCRQKVMDHRPYDATCDRECRHKQCESGCSSWMENKNAACPSLCNATDSVLRQEDLYCIMGCHTAVTSYVAKLKKHIGTPPGPYLVPGSQGHSHLTIEWEPSQLEKNVTYLVQWRYADIPGGWKYYRPENPLTENRVTLDQLHSYTKYKLRVAWLLLDNHPPLFSEESMAISTLAHGPPASPPQHLAATALDSHRIAIMWQAPQFPNGPLVSYALYVQQPDSKYLTVKDVSPSQHNSRYTFSGLQPNTSYVVGVLARNGEGEGPKSEVVVKTPRETDDKENLNGALLIATRKNVYRQSLGKVLLDRPEYYLKITNPKGDNDVQSIALHLRENCFFVSNMLGYVAQIPWELGKLKRQILTPNDLNGIPVKMSVDWLYNKLYLLVKAERYFHISRCDLDGQNIKVLITGITEEVRHIESDPYHGYILWSTASSLMKADLALLERGPEITTILSDSKLGAFTIDYHSSRILIPDEAKNTILSVHIYGSEVTDIRANTQQPQFTLVKSLVYFNGLFHWTNGHDVIGEDYSPRINKYFHNTFSNQDSDDEFVGLNLLHAVAQPVPPPLTPPEQIQAVFSSDGALVSWQPPKTLDGLGRGAWREWEYELHIVDESNFTIFKKEIKNTEYLVNNLLPSKKYSLKCRASSLGGDGPWGDYFVGRTLEKTEFQPYILWGANQAVLRTNLFGEDLVSLFQTSDILGNTKTKIQVKDLTILHNTIYLVLGTGQCYAHNMTSGTSMFIFGIGHVSSLAPDPLGGKLYWANPEQQVISRSAPDGSGIEILPIPTIARYLNVDSTGGYLYWATSHSVECSRLHGEDRQVYYRAGLFSGKQVSGLALDTVNGFVYWLVRSHPGTSLFRAKLVDRLKIGEKIQSSIGDIKLFAGLAAQGPLRYFQDRILWLTEDREAVISDIEGEYVSVLKSVSVQNMTTVYVVENSESDSLVLGKSVIPHRVMKSSIRIVGVWNNFTIFWEPVTNVNAAKVFYEIKCESAYFWQSVTTQNPYFVMSKYPPAYTSLRVAIRPFTYWGSAPGTVRELHTPMAVPGKPDNPRFYYSYQLKDYFGTKAYTGEFRWKTPLSSNGIIRNYFVTCLKGNLDLCGNTTLPGNATKYVIHPLDPDASYTFQVSAATDAGRGQATRPVIRSVVDSHFVPKLLLPTRNGLKGYDVDDNKETFYISHSSPVTAMVPILFDEVLFWLDEDNRLYRSYWNGTQKTKLESLRGKATHITVDWVARQLYWTELDFTLKNSGIYRLDLTRYPDTHSPQLLVNIPKKVSCLVVEASKRKLIWTAVEESGFGRIMVSDLEGTSIKPLFSNGNSTCNCNPTKPILSPLAMDLTWNHSSFVYFVEAESLALYKADTDGCSCQQLLENVPSIPGFPPTSMAVDSSILYWFNKTNQMVYYVSKDSRVIHNFSVRGVTGIYAWNEMSQPYPEARCLVPGATDHLPDIANITATSVTLYLGQVTPPKECGWSMASILFTVLYDRPAAGEDLPCITSPEGCPRIESYDPLVTITDLVSYTDYSVALVLRNYYTLLFGQPKLSRVLKFSTLPGAPSPPRNVKAVPITPDRIAVSWLTPAHPNGANLTYDVLWRTQEMVGGITHSETSKMGYVSNTTRGVSTKFIQVELGNLQPSSLYEIWVRVYSNNKMGYNESDSINVTTLTEPPSLVQINATSTSVTLGWSAPDTGEVVKHNLQYSTVGVDNWKFFLPNVVPTRAGQQFTYRITELRPATKYRARIVAYYEMSQIPFMWPRHNHFQYKTLGDRPDAPGVPSIQRFNETEYRVIWEAPNPNGDPIMFYALEGLIEPKSHWTLLYNGTNSYWNIEDLDLSKGLIFRVRAENKFGVGEPSVSTLNFTPQSALISNKETALILKISVPLFVTLVGIICLGIYFALKRRGNEKKDMELRTLRNLPENSTHQTNVLYGFQDPQTNEDLASLPLLGRKNIQLTHLIGSGAFGEVYEGFVNRLPGTQGWTKVAIKALRKGASGNEKEEFLKEAALMNNFKHEHILSILGVCLDNIPNLIILELMEGGDLLSYLRSNRPIGTSHSSLTMYDLFEICVDVAKGCRYLEVMHFVHRDLACRNCLVTSNSSLTRKVKIGDFGLARDIYKSDYYRKEGEGLLPVRWMAPESLIDGVFTCQSDVWSFGVLLWEIITLGQQPYPARTNVEVLHYVRSGGRLDKPPGCPKELHNLMEKCWSYHPDGRPSFKYCFDKLQELLDNTNEVHQIPIFNNHCYINRPGVYYNDCLLSEQIAVSGFDNQAYHTDMHENIGDQSKDNIDPRPDAPVNSPSDTITDSPHQIPRYLELVSGQGSLAMDTTPDGYEVPIAGDPQTFLLPDCSSSPSESRISEASVATTVEECDSPDLIGDYCSMGPGVPISPAPAPPTIGYINVGRSEELYRDLAKSCGSEETTCRPTQGLEIIPGSSWC